MRKIFQVLLVVAVVSLGVVSSFAADKPADSKVVVYYFHGNFRCSNCHNIEQYTKEAVEKYFPQELNSGKILLSVINVDKKENKYFVKQYQLYTRSVVLSLVKNGQELKFDNLPKVWEYLRDKEAFQQYIKLEVEKYLKELGE